MKKKKYKRESERRNKKRMRKRERKRKTERTDCGRTCFLESPDGLEEPPESRRSSNRGGENERQ